jgi:hypothetical protein
LDRKTRESVERPKRSARDFNGRGIRRRDAPIGQCRVIGVITSGAVADQ